jgi:hypothetical protein
MGADGVFRRWSLVMSTVGWMAGRIIRPDPELLMF